MKKQRKSNNKRKWSPAKKKYIQDFYPFRYILDNYVEMDNGDVNIILKVKASNIDLLSRDEVEGLIDELSRNMDKVKYTFSFFIQDSMYSVERPLRIYQKTARSSTCAFVRDLAEEYMEELKDNQDEVAKKQSFLRVYIPSLDVKKIPDLQAYIQRIKTVFRSSVDLMDCGKEEIKQLLAIHANRLFTDKLPDTEIPFDDNTKAYLTKKKQIPYEYSSTAGIYDFKDMIVPATITIRSANITVGKNLCKVFGVRSFMGTTENTALLSRICAIKGVTSQIYIESMKASTFRSLLKKDLRSKKAGIMDELDAVEATEAVDVSLKAFQSTSRKKRNVYYVSTYFMVTGKNQKEFDQIVEEFLDEIDAVEITLDPLETLQLDAYLSINPLGSNRLADRLKQNIPSLSVGNLYPFNEPALLDPDGLPIGKVMDTTKPILYDPLSTVRDNQNALLLGTSGTGKTTALMKLLENGILSGAEVRNIDLEGTYTAFAEQLGGINISVCGNNEFCINRLQIRLPDEVTKGIVDDYISEVRGWMRLYKPGWSERHLDLFERYLGKAYAAKGLRNDDLDFNRLQPTDYPVIGDVYDLIKADLDNGRIISSLADTAEDILLGLESAVHGADAKLFNRHTYLGNVGQHDAFINFDLSGMMSADLSKKLAQWDNIFSFNAQYVNQNMDRSKRIILSIDEVHELLKREYRSLVHSISSYERRFRKYNACFIISTQTQDEVVSDDPVMSALVKPLFSIPSTKFLFYLGDTDYDRVQKLLSLKDTELDLIRRKNRPKGACVLRTGATSYDLQVDMPEWFKLVKTDAKDTAL